MYGSGNIKQGLYINLEGWGWGGDGWGFKGGDTCVPVADSVEV